MDLDDAARGFAAMGSESRLRVLKALVRAGEEGLAVGELQARTAIAPTTLNHHLRSLAGAGVIEQERAGRVILNRAAYDRLEALAGFILEECCADARRQGAKDG